MNASRELAISPDGQKIVYVANRNGKSQLFLRALGDSEGKPIEGTDGAVTAFFSPDSQWIAFGTMDRPCRKPRSAAGRPSPSANLSSTGFYGGDWGADNTIVFVPDYNGGLWTVSANGGTPQPLLKTDVDKDRVCYSDPQILPGGRGVLFTLASGRAVTADDEDVAVIEPGSRDPRILIRGASHPRYLPTGHVVYVHAGASAGGHIRPLDAGDHRYSCFGDRRARQDLERRYRLFHFRQRDSRVRSRRGPQHRAASLFSPIARETSGRYRRGAAITPSFPSHRTAESLASRVFAVNDDIWTYDIASGAPLRLTFEPLDEIFPAVDGRRRPHRVWHAHRHDLLEIVGWLRARRRTHSRCVSPVSDIVLTRRHADGVCRNPSVAATGHLADAA